MPKISGYEHPKTFLSNLGQGKIKLQIYACLHIFLTTKPLNNQPTELIVVWLVNASKR